MVRFTIGVVSALLVAMASARYESAPDFEIPEGATILPPTKFCLDNPPIPYIPYTPDGGIQSAPTAPPNGCEPAMVFCGLNPNITQRVDWCASCAGMPPGMGWSNNIQYATTTNCALGARYSDCNLDNEEGIDIGSVVVSVVDQSFTVSLNAGYEITGYNLQVGPNLDTAASANFASYQTKGGSLADGASVTSAVSFQGSDWFVMHAMVCPVGGERTRSDDDPEGAGGIGGGVLQSTRAPTLAPTPAPTFNRTEVGNLLGDSCNPHMALKSCPAEKFKMYFSRTVSRSAWASTTAQMAETQGMCLNKPGATRLPAGFNGTVKTIKGGDFITKTWRNQTERSQSWVFKWTHRHCYIIDAAARTTSGQCLGTNQQNISEWCEEFQFNSPTVNINRTEIIFGCCDMTGDGNVTVDVGDLRYADEGTQDGGNKTTKFGDDATRSSCESYQDYDLPDCEGPFCQGSQTCSLRRGLQQLRFDSWPDVPVDEREEVFIQVMIIDTGEIYNFTHNTTGFPGKIVNGTTPDNFFIRPSFYVENRAWFNAFYNAQYRDGIALQFYSTTRGPGGWNACVFSPIGIDITNSNKVHMIEGNFSINIDGNELTSTGNEAGDEFLNFWFGPQVGILVHNPPNQDNNITTANGEITGHHMLGDMGGQYADGYAKLATFDTNEDGEVSGAELQNFHLWVDANSNAHLDAGELKSLQQFNIVALYTMHDCRKSRARLANGVEILTEDLWFSRRRRRLR